MELLNKISEKGFFYRIENDEECVYLSIIDRQVYPRIWSDNVISGDFKIESESDENFIERTFISGKDWAQRWHGDTIDECLQQAEKWFNSLQ
ncbi:hypothetical protein [Sphingobacterium sp.]|uniref:hypothetical protein n=1 Tax=Sphingobacterium sp. TaxID=341027 RepID=UPI0028A1AA56|nr:hypothetical protein [Sphingobacterium sp.]